MKGHDYTPPQSVLSLTRAQIQEEETLRHRVDGPYAFDGTNLRCCFWQRGKRFHRGLAMHDLRCDLVEANEVAAEKGSSLWLLELKIEDH